MPLLKNRYKYIILTGIIIACAFWYNKSTHNAPTTSLTASSTKLAAKTALTVELVQPRAISMPLTIYANGNFSAWQEAILGAEANGLAIKEIFVNIGSRVKKGQLIATLSDSNIRAEIAQSEANLAEARAALIEAKANANRARLAQGTGVLSDQIIDQYLNAEQVAQARVEAAKAQLNVHSVRLKQTQLFAIDDGIISKRDATIGMVVTPNMELFRLIRQGKVEWRGEVNADEVAQLKPSMKVKLTLPNHQEVTGTLRSIAPTTDSRTRNTLIYVDVPPMVANPGAFAKGEIVLGNQNVDSLPVNAIILRDGFHYALSIDQQQRVHLVKVSLGARQGEWVQVLGLPDSQGHYIASGGAFLSDGDLVRIAPPAKP